MSSEQKVLNVFKKYKHAIIVDLDGTLCDDSHRRHAIPAKSLYGSLPPATIDAMWNEYHRDIPHDVPVPQMMTILQFAMASGIMVIYLTGREKKFFDVTNSWLQKNVGDTSEHILFMRDNGCRKPSAVFKKEMLFEIQGFLYSLGIEIVAAFDDREDIYAMFCENKVPAIRVVDYKIGDEQNVGYIMAHLAQYSRPVEVNISERKEGPANPLPQRFDLLAKQDDELRSGEVPDKWGFKPIDYSKLPSAPEVRLESNGFSEKISELAPASVPSILNQMAATFAERNAIYRNNWETVAAIMKVLFPNGVELTSEKDHEIYHLFVQVIGKLTRFSTANFTHIDSIHDAAVYCAIIESITSANTIKAK